MPSQLDLLDRPIDESVARSFPRGLGGQHVRAELFIQILQARSDVHRVSDDCVGQPFP